MRREANRKTSKYHQNIISEFKIELIIIWCKFGASVSCENIHSRDFATNKLGNYSINVFIKVWISQFKIFNLRPTNQIYEIRRLVDISISRSMQKQNLCKGNLLLCEFTIYEYQIFLWNLKFLNFHIVRYDWNAKIYHIHTKKWQNREYESELLTGSLTHNSPRWSRVCWNNVEWHKKY